MPRLLQCFRRPSEKTDDVPKLYQFPSQAVSTLRVSSASTCTPQAKCQNRAALRMTHPMKTGFDLADPRAPRALPLGNAAREVRSSGVRMAFPRRNATPEKEEVDELFADLPFSEEDIKEAAFLLTRLLSASVMVHHGQEKLLSVDLFTSCTIDQYFNFLPGPHEFYTYAAGWAQYAGAILLGLGVFSRVSGLALSGTMVGAIFYSLSAIGLEGFPGFELRGLSQTLKYGVGNFHNYTFETPALYLACYLLVAAAGPGKFSVAEILGWNDDKTLLGKLKQ